MKKSVLLIFQKINTVISSDARGTEIGKEILYSRLKLLFFHYAQFADICNDIRSTCTTGVQDIGMIREINKKSLYER